MKKRLFNFIQALHKLSFFDMFLGGTFLVGGLVVFIVLLQKPTYVTVRVRITQQDVIYVSNNPPAWYTYLFRPGMKERNYLGQATAEILDVYHYEALGFLTDDLISKRILYLTIRLRGSYNRRTNEYKYKGTALTVGSLLRINFGSVLIQGLIVDVDNIANPFKTVYKTVKTRLQESNPVFPGTSGVDQYVADAIKTGDRVLDSKGETAAEVLAKEMQPAFSVAVDSQGFPRTYAHPRKKDVYLTVRLKLKAVGNELYYFDDFLVKTGAVIPLNFSTINLRTVIIENPDNAVN